MAIDWAHSTKVERDTVANALDAYERQLKRQERLSQNHAVRNNASWRLHVVEQVRAELAGR